MVRRRQKWNEKLLITDEFASSAAAMKSSPDRYPLAGWDDCSGDGADDQANAGSDRCEDNHDAARRAVANIVAAERCSDNGARSGERAHYAPDDHVPGARPRFRSAKLKLADGGERHVQRIAFVERDPDRVSVPR
jgi:hypothetical protein